MLKIRNRICRVCKTPCTGTVCRDCFRVKNNKIAGRYNKLFMNLVNHPEQYDNKKIEVKERITD